MKYREVPIMGPRVGEEEAQAVYEVIKKGHLCEGPKVREFEEAFAAFIGVKHCVVCFNGTVGLHLLWLALGIGPGDEVIVPSLTFISTAVSLLYVGARPVFAEVEPVTFNLDPADVKKKITKNTRIIVPVHYAGQMATMDELAVIAEENGLLLVEDAAEAAGARINGKRAGSCGKAAMFSFTPTKNMTTGEGGLIATDDQSIASKIRLLKNHGMDREYHHVEMGYNYRMTEMQAAMGIVQLGKLKETLEIKIRNAALYASLLAGVEGITVPIIADGRNHTYMIYTLKLDTSKLKLSRDEIMTGLRKRGIQAKLYFPPAHLQPVFAGLGHREGDLPVTEELSRQLLSLPIHSRLTEEDITFVADSLKEILAGE